MQPTIFPLFKTRPFQTSLLKWAQPAGQADAGKADYETYFREFWSGRLGGQQGLDKVLQDGIIS